MTQIRDWRWWVFIGCLMGGFGGMLAAGYFLGQWGMSVERAKWADERGALMKRFPIARADERAACTREYSAQIEGLKATAAARDAMASQTAADVVDMKSLMKTTNDLAAYTLRFLGDRARVNDERSATMLKQTREAAAAATAAQKTTVQVEQKVSVAADKADEAASTAKAVDRKLDTATHPALPAKPWAGGNR
ncbi:hypothetical protein B0G76_1371 [Paraburkholderia sp. BL23I1N1]|uniref:hypothetical protein n=1 Tax=Paraburkholderia sp. BL23I1N1 TaxID=1938802 RepID=UPI000E741CC4|nr:hypothetical protein [Paraburkholderia sp. BL23I1N1]RKE35308.1 hypothetical protein B0G76_1371 [Paraburkholderia sp. BL23I1N1]